MRVRTDLIRLRLGFDGCGCGGGEMATCVVLWEHLTPTPCSTVCQAPALEDRTGGDLRR